MLKRRYWESAGKTESTAASAVVWCFVSDLCKDFDIILGNTFLMGHNAILNFRRLSVSLTSHGKRFTLRAGLKTAPDDQAVPELKLVGVSSMVAKLF